MTTYWTISGTRAQPVALILFVGVAYLVMYWPVVLAVIVVGIFIGINVSRLKKQRQENRNDNHHS